MLKILKLKIGLNHPLDGITKPKHKLLHFLTTKKLCKEIGAAI
jgi:hypothetical protein